MRRYVLVGLGLTLASCSWFREPPPEPARRITPGARVIYDSGMNDTIFSICDKGDRLILTTKSPQIVTVPGGCPSGQP